MEGESGPVDPAEDLFSVFLVAFLTTIVVPWTIGKFCCAEEVGGEVRQHKRKLSFKEKYVTRSNVIFCVLWLLVISLSWHISRNAEDTKPFDPFDILEVPAAATAKEIKSAYRKLSLKYHPDKNPDPAAHEYFANFVAKAYAALTDEKAKENYEKYGHPDGPKSTKFGVALPSFLFNENAQITLLASITLLAILLPGSYMLYYLKQSRKYTSSNLRVDTISLWAHPNSPVHLKQAHSVHRIVETFSCAAEFADLPLDKKNYPHLDALMKMLIKVKAIREGEKMFKKKVEFVRSHFVLLAHQHRVPIPMALDPKKVLALAPKLLTELAKVATLPRVPRLNYGWFVPSEAVVENMQCFSQAVPTDIKRPRSVDATGSSKPVKGRQGLAGLFQLPHMTDQRIKLMARGTPDGAIKARSLEDLIQLPEQKARSLLGYVSFQALSAVSKAQSQAQKKPPPSHEQLKAMTLQQTNQTMMMVSALPRVVVDKCDIYVDGEEGIVNYDPMTTMLHLKVKRNNFIDKIKQALQADEKTRQGMQELMTEFLAAPSEKKCTTKYVLEMLEELIPCPKLKGKTIMAETPRLGDIKKPEKWYLFLGDPKSNLLYCNACLELNEAEEFGFKDSVVEFFCGMCHGSYMAKNEGKELPVELVARLEKVKEGVGSWKVAMMCLAPPAGTYDLSVLILSDSYLGRDVMIKKKKTVDSKARVPGAEAGGGCCANASCGPGQGENGAQAKAEADDAAGEKSENSDESSATKVKVAEADDDDEDEAAFSSDDEGVTSAAANGAGAPPKANGKEGEIESGAAAAAVKDDEEDEDSDSYSDSDDSIDSDFSYDSQDTGTDIDEEDAALETKTWTVQPKEDNPEPKKTR